MLRCMITATELYYYYPRIEAWIDNSHVAQILQAATNIVATDMRNKGVDTQRVYLPLCIDSTFGKPTTFDSVTSGSVALGNERRFVVEVTSTTGCTLSIQGSIDNENWNPITMFDGTNATIEVDTIGVYSRAFVEGYRYIRFISDGSFEGFCYLVDTSLDMLIITKALCLITLPLMGNDGLAEAMYGQSVPMYQSLLGSAIYDYDRNGTGTVDNQEADVKPRRRVMR